MWRTSPLCWWSLYHHDVIKWKQFPRYWPFVWVIHRSPVNSPHKGQWRRALMFSLICALNKRFSKQSWGWRFETPSCSLWRQCIAYFNREEWRHCTRLFQEQYFQENMKYLADFQWIFFHFDVHMQTANTPLWVFLQDNIPITKHVYLCHLR